MLRSILLASLTLGLVACGGPSSEPTDTASDATVTPGTAFEVTGAFVRPPQNGRPNTAAYFTITSHIDSDASIVGVSTDGSETAELHTHAMSDGMMRMRQVQSVDLPAGGSMDFQPLGHHVMMFRVSDETVEGSSVTITLDIFHDDETEQVTFEAPVQLQN